VVAWYCTSRKTFVAASIAAANRSVAIQEMAMSGDVSSVKQPAAAWVRYNLNGLLFD
jgi:hypothetical protein